MKQTLKEKIKEEIMSKFGALIVSREIAERESYRLADKILHLFQQEVEKMRKKYYCEWNHNKGDIEEKLCEGCRASNRVLDDIRTQLLKSLGE